MDKYKLEFYWNDIPIGKQNAVSYNELCPSWGRCERDVRMILHELSSFDNGDDYILIRSSKKRGGFYRTDNRLEIEDYKQECLSKGKSIFAPIKKINRVLREDTRQVSFYNNLRVRREGMAMKQSEVCEIMQKYDKAIDCAMLSKMENNVCLPTPYQLSILADIYNCMPSDLVSYS